MLEASTIQLPPAELTRLVRDTRARTLELVGDLAGDRMRVPLLEIVNPFLWELGHVAFFYEAFFLRELGCVTEPLLAGGDDLYNSFTVQHDDRWELSLPTHGETLDYMRRVEERVAARLGEGEPGPRETYLGMLAVLHEDMHGEAFTYMRQTLGYPAPARPAGAQQASTEVGGGAAGDVSVPGGRVLVGADPGAGAFVFDNEKWAHPVDVAPFEIARAPVTNVEFAEFVEDRGYRRRELWSREGWQWRARAEAERPRDWRRSDGGWECREFDRHVPLAEHAPVCHVNWYEAEAYCNWAGRRLPTETEWEAAATGGGVEGPRRRYPWGDADPTPVHANLDARLGGCAEVGAFAAGDSACGCRQMLGNVWEWTASAFYPYPGFVVDTPYREYSAPWFGDRKVLRGGAWATRSRLVTSAYRNFFPPHRNDLFAGFRTCARKRGDGVTLPGGG